MCCAVQWHVVCPRLVCQRLLAHVTVVPCLVSCTTSCLWFFRCLLVDVCGAPVLNSTHSLALLVQTLAFSCITIFVFFFLFFILWNVTQPPGDRVACLKAGPCWRGRRVSRAPPFWAGVLCFRQGYQWLKDKILSEEGRRQQAKLKELQAIAERLGCTLPQLAIGTQTHSAALSLSVCLSVPLPRRSAAPPQLSGFECRACVWVCLCCDVWCLRNQR